MLFRSLPVELDLGRLQARDELVVRETVRASCGVDSHDPEPAERPLLVLAITVRIAERVLDLLLRVAVRGLLQPPVPLRLAENLAPLLEDPHVGLVDRGVLSETPLALRGLLLQVVALHCAAPQQLAAGGDLKPLLDAARRFRFRHLASSPRSSWAQEPSPCCGRRGAAAIRSGRSP